MLTVVSTWIAPGFVQFLGGGKMFSHGLDPKPTSLELSISAAF
jgi:hypothetical protein